MTAVAIAAALGSASCLVGHRTLQADAETTPLIPPSIIESQTSPLPGRLILFTNTDPTTLTFTVKVARTTVIDEDHPLQPGRVFTDRPRPCTGPQCRERGADVDCIAGLNGGQVRTCTFTRNVEPGCHIVDFYVSSLFRPDFTTEPEREGDSAHVRWYLVRQDTNGDYPSIVDCQN